MTKAGPHSTGRDYTDEEIRSFVLDLESLPGGDLTVSLLIGCGARAIPPLREYLLNGRPRGIFQPRQRAVEALAQLGAKDVLFEYLSQTREISDAVVRHGEEAVENTAARELSRWLTEDVYEFVFRLAEHRMRVGLIETLGEFERPETARVMLHGLGDGVCRTAAEAALSRIAPRVKDALLRAVQRSEAGGEETPSERERRRSVLRILCGISLTAVDWIEVRPLLRDRDKGTAILAAEVGMDCAPVEEKQEVARFLIRSLDGAPWFLQIRIQDCLKRNFPMVQELIRKESLLRRQMAKGEPLADPVLRILESIQSSAEKSGPKENKRHGK
jgi:hypothetical protein